jgi:hypothetical protein
MAWREEEEDGGRGAGEMDGRGAGDTALGRMGERVGPGSGLSGPPPALELKEVPVGGVIFWGGGDGR